jgi:hypothetical protein
LRSFRVVISCDDSDYVRFLPIISAAYRKFFRCTISMGFVSDKGKQECVEKFGSYVDDVWVFPRMKGYHQIALAKMASTWLLCQFEDELVMIGDMDRIPLSSKYLQELADAHKSGTISCTGKECYVGELDKKIPMCYTFAESSVWRRLICPNNTFEAFVIENSGAKRMFDNKEDALNSGGKFSDESIVRTFLAKRNMLPVVRNVPKIFHAMKNTIDRKKWRIDTKRLESGSYVECHSIRPTKENMPKLQPLFDFFGVEQL